MASGDLSFGELHRRAYHNHGFAPLLSHTLVVELVWAVMKQFERVGASHLHDLGCGRLWLAVLAVLDVEAEY